MSLGPAGLSDSATKPPEPVRPQYERSDLSSKGEHYGAARSLLRFDQPDLGAPNLVQPNASIFQDSYSQC